MTSIEIPVSIAAALPSLAVMDITNDVSREVGRAEVTHGIAYLHAESPLSLVRATAARLADAGYALPEEIEVAKEDVHFRLPKEVAQA